MAKLPAVNTVSYHCPNMGLESDEHEQVESAEQVERFETALRRKGGCGGGGHYVVVISCDFCKVME